MRPTIKIILDKRSKKVTGLYPVKLRITYNRKQEYYSCNYDMSVQDFDNLFATKLTRQQLKIKQSFNEIETKAIEITRNLRVFSFKEFEFEYFSEEKDKNDVFALFDEIIELLNKEDRVGTAISYSNARNSIKTYKNNLSFADITPEFLKGYEKYMVSKGSSLSTIGFYLRAFRRIYNVAISRKLVHKEDYPFGMNSYRIPKGGSVKKALSIEDIQEIFEYKVIPSSPMHRAKDFWMFTYLCSGINMTDIAHLRFKDISDDEIHFVRQKTIRSQKNAKMVNVTLLPETLDIIKRWSNTQTSPNDYVFPILLPEMNAVQIKNACNNFLKSVNKFMKRIAVDLGIDKNLTTYVARHSFATILKRSGASTEFIQEQLAHADKSTTENYLSSFEKEKRLKTTKALTNFKKPKNLLKNNKI